MTERRVLDNWKEIAAYLGRTGKTCRNWEKEYGLPVHRLDGSSRAHVFAYADEIDRWKQEMLREEQRHKEGAHALKWEKELLRQDKAWRLLFRLLPRLFRRPLRAIPAILILAGVIASAVWYFHRESKIRYAKDILLPKAVQLAEDTGTYDYPGSQKVFEAAVEAEKYLPKESALAEILKKYSTRVTVTTNPPGASVYIRPYQMPATPWEYLGDSPVESHRLPLQYLFLKLEKEGYETVLAARTSWDIDFKVLAIIPLKISWKLDKQGDLPPGMVRVAGVEDQTVGKIGDFFIDKFEVTNRQFKEFMDKGGYKNKEFWKEPFLKEGKTLSWEQAMAEFVDVTGRPGPATWQGGGYPEGQDDYPVSGVSWYEAAAYAEFAHKNLPTGNHWGMAQGYWTSLGRFTGFADVFVPQSNFKGKGRERVGSNQAITAYEIYDMGGNVREWCWNETGPGRLVRGGAWDDAPYMFGAWSRLPPFDRSAQNGFRCAIYIDPDRIPPSSFASVKTFEFPDLSKRSPVSDAEFRIYRDQLFSYDKRELNARVEWRKESSPDWIQEKISFDAAYENDRVFAYLFLPRNSAPPFQTVLYYPTSDACFFRASKDMDKYFEFMPFLLRNGRAFLFPIYRGTFERGDDGFLRLFSAQDSYQFSEYLIKTVKDFRRCVDYLETRSDIDRAKLAYLGWSWGGINGPIVTAIEDRLKASVLRQGGYRWPRRPETDPFNYVSRVKIPTLMLNGRYDTVFPLESGVKPMFRLLGAAHKELKVYDTDHTIPNVEFIRETLRWLDKYLGPVR